MIEMARSSETTTDSPRSGDPLLQLRLAELAIAEAFMRPLGTGARVLEVGAGSGHQAAALTAMGYQVNAIDLSSSPYFHVQAHTVLPFDGCHIPFPDQTFDVVYSSNVLEHVKELEPLLSEMRRVLKPGGLSVHLMPSSAWRSWSLLTHFAWAAKRLFQVTLKKGGDDGVAELGRVKSPVTLRSAAASMLPQRHGEHGTAVGEVFTYRRARWVRDITASGLEFISSKPAGIFYTNSMVLGRHLSLHARQRLALLAGSGCNVYVFRNDGASDRQHASGPR